MFNLNMLCPSFSHLLLLLCFLFLWGGILMKHKAFEALVISVYDTDKAKSGGQGRGRGQGPAGNVKLQPQNQGGQNQQKRGCCGGGGGNKN
jgi:hypothetical protein